MEVQAKARYLRTSPRKIRYVIDVIRGMQVEKAQQQLSFSKKQAAGLVLKLLNSAIANARHNFHIEDTTSLYIKHITADGGPILHRWRARAFGRSAPIRKRTTHITILLDTRDTETKIKKASTKKVKA
ncbi:TPA: 50S ribosomal protein L22 [Candidatus Uhrbacteria bacterium]|uniref:Large ribosomal subunit protein uL22 n=2 Tax=Candidatus Uhriibacteriota TaxID=1752732 RepID=A0A0G1SGJ2_9BACT|nr:MAG: 50S ribosomal protein L22 [Candidatus Uhrbacteria bacterium GW2011_GWF2_46_218]KKU41188.1 MAG: 50S ribosomal protein L22 [Candidatus Uhrbacteria bacterium GW2011_GWE2_46_68]HBK34035.1 50S ribosomal protein L22 [Candidatus Uhrbacteria bacterium]HCB18887.1 50S ribosomal protein L22 [Candidatus Uhrbacteria bacterium]